MAAKLKPHNFNGLGLVLNMVISYGKYFFWQDLITMSDALNESLLKHLYFRLFNEDMHVCSTQPPSECCSKQ